MADLIDDFAYRTSLVASLTYDEADARLSGLYQWLKSQPEICTITDRLETEIGAAELLESAGDHSPPHATSPDQIAGVGLLLLKEINGGAQAFRLSRKYGITPSFSTSHLQDYYDSVFERFLSPALEYIQREVATSTATNVRPTSSLASETHPLEITDSLARFFKDHPEPRRTAFIMMQFGDTQMHESIVAAIRSTLSGYGITGLRADDREYHDDLFPNVLTYMHGCGFGISVFERLEADDFNPNVSLEVGYLRALRKPVCLLKDKTLRTLQADLVGKLYKEFDPQDPEGTIPQELQKWLEDKDIIT